MKTLVLLLGLVLAGCTAMPDGPENTREVVLQYLGSDAGTAGPFSKKSLKELNTLSAKDRDAALALFDRGAVAFLVFQADHSMRIVFVLRRQVVGDFRAASPAS